MKLNQLCIKSSFVAFFIMLFIPGVTFAQTPITQDNIQEAVDAWCLNPDSTEAIYGHISDWDVSLITDMSGLFQLKPTFNDVISNWDVSNVTNY